MTTWLHLTANMYKAKYFWLFQLQFFYLKHHTEHFKTLIELVYAIVCHLLEIYLMNVIDVFLRAVV